MSLILRPVPLLELVGRENKRTDQGHPLVFPRCGKCKVTIEREDGTLVTHMKYVDSSDILEMTGERIKLRGRCHGRETTLDVTLPTAINRDAPDADDEALIRAALRSAVFFDSELER